MIAVSFGAFIKGEPVIHSIPDWQMPLILKVAKYNKNTLTGFPHYDAEDSEQFFICKLIEVLRTTPFRHEGKNAHLSREQSFLRYCRAICSSRKKNAMRDILRCRNTSPEIDKAVRLMCAMDFRHIDKDIRNGWTSKESLPLENVETKDLIQSLRAFLSTDTLREALDAVQIGGHIDPDVRRKLQQETAEFYRQRDWSVPGKSEVARQNDDAKLVSDIRQTIPDNLKADFDKGLRNEPIDSTTLSTLQDLIDKYHRENKNGD